MSADKKRIRELEKRCGYFQEKGRILKHDLKAARAENERLTRSNGLLRRQAARLQAAAIRAMGLYLDKRIGEGRAA